MNISVIIPVYNVEDYLGVCIDSVISQTNIRFEIILVDDGSTDGSGKLCDYYGMRYPDKIVVIHTNNMGPMYARIQGIRKACGDILVFLDSDDCLRSNALEVIAKCFSTQGCDMVLYNAAVCSEFPSKSIIYPFSNGQIFENESKKTLYYKLISSQISNSVWSKAIKRDCATLPESFSQLTRINHGEDLLMSAHFISNCKKIVYLDRGLYHYRMRPGSAIHSFDFKRAESIKTVHTELEKYIDAWEMPELKPVHNARKVKGWVENLLLLLKSKDSMPKAEFRNQLRSMAEDPYFLSAYAGMEPSSLTHSYRTLAFCLIKKQYFILSMLFCVKQSAQKIKSLIFRRNNDG